MNNLINIQDAFIIPFLLFVIYLISSRIKSKNIDDKPYYKYFKTGLFIKIFGGLALSLVYTFYYGVSDTAYYFWGSGNIVRMLSKDLPTFFKLIIGENGVEILSMFDLNTGYPTYFKDFNAFTVCRLNVPFYVLGFGSFLGNNIVMNFFLYLGIWQFYKMLVQLYPNNEKYLAYGLFFVPSIFFWGGGILKDGWTLTALLCFNVNIWHIFIKKQKPIKHILFLMFWGYVAFSIRPYIFYVALISGLIWIGFNYIKKVKGTFLRLIVFPFIVLVFWIIGSAIFIKTASMSFRRYSDIDSILETAWIIQDDLKKDYYGGNTFDIGTFEPTIPGILKKFPQAVTAGLFRPFIWDSKNILMVISAIENFAVLILFLWILIKLKLKFFSNIYKDPFLLSFFVTAITFAFFIGLTTANFGSLVRYSIICRMPFIIILLQILHLYKEQIKNNVDI